MILINRKRKKVFFSIITVTKNSHLTLRKCIKSVNNQTFKNFEHIIIDGGSGKKTLNIIKNNSKNISYAISEKDKNLWQAINKGIKASKGEVICILNSDDIFFKNALKIGYKYFKSKKIGYLFGSVKKNKIYGNFYPEQINYKFNIFPSHSISFFVKKKLHNQIGLYDENLNFCADYDFILKLVNKKIAYACSKPNEVFGKFSKGGISTKISIFEKIYYESKVRINNNQNFFIVLLLGLLHFLNFLRNRLLLILRIKKSLNW
tara:strand:- start:223 stop:1008 length:786 start_codon:yes stop_codon:yes gene_type:complete